MKKAEWIWIDCSLLPEGAGGQPTVFAPRAAYYVARLEKTFRAPRGRARAEIAADVKYVLRLNGEIVARGPAAVGGDYGNDRPLGWCFVDRPTLELKEGENVLVAEVQSVPEVMADYSSGIPGFYMRLCHEGGEVTTDESWRGSVAREYAGIRDYDGCAEGGEVLPAVLSPRETEMLEKDLPELEYAEAFPLSEETGEGERVFDFGRIVAGYIDLRAECAERARLVLDPLEVPGRSMFPEKVRFAAGQGRYESLRLHSFRYLSVKGGDGVSVRALLPRLPEPAEGSFFCTDRALMRVHGDSLSALRMCRQTYHLDSPIHQEALGCTGDYYIESRMAYALLGSYALSRLDIVRTAKYLETTSGAMFHTAYTLIFVRWVREHHRYTGDVALLAAVRPAVDAVLARFASFEEDGWLENPPDYLFIDWVPVGEFNLHHPPRPLGEGAMNAFYLDALRAAADIYAALGEGDLSRRLGDRADALARKFDEKLWREDRGLYAAGTPDRAGDEGSDWRPVDRSGREYFGVHANALAVAFGIARGKRAKEIVRKICTDGSLIPCQPYFYHFLVAATDEAGLFEEFGIPALRKLEEICAGGGLKEVFYGFDCDFSHAWGGTAVYDCTARILGVRPTADGFASYEVKPQLGDIERAEGRAPAPWGYVEVKAYREGGEVRAEVREVRRER